MNQPQVAEVAGASSAIVVAWIAPALAAHG